MVVHFGFQAPSNLIFLTIVVTMRPLTQFQSKITPTKLLKSATFYGKEAVVGHMPQKIPKVV